MGSVGMLIASRSVRSSSQPGPGAGRDRQLRARRGPPHLRTPWNPGFTGTWRG